MQIVEEDIICASLHGLHVNEMKEVTLRYMLQ